MRSLLAATACAALIVLQSVPAEAQAPLVSGGGAGYFPDEVPVFGGDRVEVTLVADASGGRFTGVHWRDSGGVFAKVTGVVDCATTVGDTVVATGVITAGFHGTGINPVGERLSLAVTADSFAIDLGFLSGHPIAPCTSDPILALPVSQGGFRLH